MSRKSFGAKPLSYPQPVWIIATYDADGVPDAMNAAWGGISEEREVAVCLECRVIDFNTETCILRGEIVNVSVDESALTDDEVDIRKVEPICIDPFNHSYHLIGEKVGMAWESGQVLM